MLTLVVVNCMKIFGGDNKEVAEYGCASIRKLATDIDNRKSLGDLGACEGIPDPDTTMFPLLRVGSI